MSILRILGAKLFNKKYPHSVQLNVTYHCNLRCQYCASYEDRTPEMTTEQIFRLLDEFAGMGTSRFSITGGEPLLRKDLPDIIHHARKLGLFVSVASNATFIPQRLSYLKEASIVNMTLDGPEEIHDKQRGKGNYKQIINAVPLFKEAKIPLYLISVLTKSNCSVIEQTLELGRSLGVALLIQPVFYNKLSHAHDLQGYKEARYDDQVMIETLDYIIKQKEEGRADIVMSKRYYRNVQESIRNKTMMVCKNGGNMFNSISPEGKVTPCNLLVRGERWLNGNEVGFREAYEKMPPPNCAGCITSLIDIDDVYNLKPDVVLNYLKVW